MNTCLSNRWLVLFAQVSRGLLQIAARPCFVIVAAALVVHGLLLVSDGVYWDGWLIYTWLTEKNWAELHAWARESGVPWLAYLHGSMGRLPSVVFGYKAVAFVITVLSALLTYRICKGSCFLSRAESLAVALISLCYPAFQVRAELIVLPYSLFYCVFLLGVWLAMCAERAEGAGHVVWRSCALASFFVAFAVNSLLMFFFGVLLFLFFYAKQTSGRSWGVMFTRLLPRRLDYLMLPFLYWGFTRTFFPVHGHYAENNYNQITFSLGAFVNGCALFFANSIYTQINESLLIFMGQPVVLLALVVLAAWGYRALRVDRVQGPGVFVTYAALAYGLLLLFIGIFPYVAVGKWPTAHGWESRHSLLMALPLALIIVACLRLAFTTASGALGRAGWTVLILLLAGFSLSTMKAYVGWQARWVKDRSIMAKLADMPQAKACSVFWIEDRFPLGGEESYRFYEWAYLFKQVWGDQRRIGIDYRSGPERLASLAKKGNLFSARWALAQFDPTGPQARLTIRCAYGRTDDPYRLCALYQFYRFVRPGRMNDFLKSVVDVDVEPLSSPWEKGSK